MQPAAAFADLLDSLAGGLPAGEPARTWNPGVATRPLFSFRKPARRLSAPERDALDLLNSLGAHLTDDFTRRELRSAFRALARRFHPDANPHASGREFAAARGAYDMLSRRV
ncbi:MAG: J domain-containing protein [Acidimicrobiia bacterium]|nr:J domain-containing protein [Acidimicrobiia bacterium]